jgi:hypothetical protein
MLNPRSRVMIMRAALPSGDRKSFSPPRPRHHGGSKSSTEFEARLCSGDPNCAPITLRDEGVTAHPEDVDVPEILFAGSVGVVTAIPPEPYDAGDIGENQTSVRVALMLASAG